MAELKKFPPSDRTRTVKEALNDMMSEAGVEHVVIVGALPSGGITLMSSQMTVAQANWFLDRAKTALLSG